MDKKGKPKLDGSGKGKRKNEGRGGCDTTETKGKGFNPKKIEKTYKPGAGEKEQDFVSRCIKGEIDSGKDKDQAAAICYSVWGEAKKSEMFTALKKVLKSLVNKLK